MTTTEQWDARHLADDRYEFVNVSGSRLAMITLSPIGGSFVAVEGSQIDPHAVESAVDAGASFVASVRGAGVRIMATDVARGTHTPWEFRL